MKETGYFEEIQALKEGLCAWVYYENEVYAIKKLLPNDAVIKVEILSYGVYIIQMVHHNSLKRVIAKVRTENDMFTGLDDETIIKMTGGVLFTNLKEACDDDTFRQTD